MKTKTTLMIGGALAMVMALSGAALAHGGKDRGERGGRGGPEQILERFDSNGDGAITRAEVDAAAAQHFAEADSNGDGLLSEAELIAAAEGRNAERMERRAARMLERLDANEDGQLSIEELAARNPADRMFERLDANDDGTISAEELAEMRGHRGGRDGGRHEGRDNN